MPEYSKYSISSSLYYTGYIVSYIVDSGSEASCVTRIKRVPTYHAVSKKAPDNRQLFQGQYF